MLAALSESFSGIWQAVCQEAQDGVLLTWAPVEGGLPQVLRKGSLAPLDSHPVTRPFIEAMKPSTPSRQQRRIMVQYWEIQM